jgi:hypothetical protein
VLKLPEPQQQLTSFPKRPSLADKGALKRVSTAICKKEWGRCE